MARHRAFAMVGAAALTLGLVSAPLAAQASRPAPWVCRGTLQAPGVLTGTHWSGVIVEGVCAVNAGPAVVHGDVAVEPNAALVAAFAHNDRTGHGTSSLTVSRSVRVLPGGTALLGCLASSFPCLDDSSSHPTLASPVKVYGDLMEFAPLGVVVHDAWIGRNVQEVGGGGGVTCTPKGIFAAFGAPVYSDYEDSTVAGSVTVGGLASCWLGFARITVGGSMTLAYDRMADPDAIEVISNHVMGDLSCSFDAQHVWDNSEMGSSLFPRMPHPNTVDGRRFGQCRLSSPTSQSDKPGPGPF